MAKQDHKRVETELRDFALTYPETTEDFPWGHRAIKVKGKMFLIMAHEEDEFSLSVKLPFAAPAALSLPNVEPTGYGMGKHNWVTARWPQGERVDAAMIRSWIDESYRAIAPKKLLKMLS